MNFETLRELGDDVPVMTGFNALVSGDGVPVHWIAGEDDCFRMS